MSKFAKGFGIVALALVVSVSGALAQRGGHGGGGHGGGGHGGGWHGGGSHVGGWHGGGYRGGYYGGGYRGGYRGGYYGGGWGWGEFAAGAILGGLLAAPYYYGEPYYDSGPEDYYGPPSGNAVGYCMQRFRSYDPRSGTYLGFDGYRHPCP